MARWSWRLSTLAAVSPRCFRATLLETLDGGSLSFGDLAVATDAGSGAVYARAMYKQARSRFGLVFQNYNLFPHIP
ncbi:MAG: hypothetical protein ACLRM9_05850 [Collinsella aerofaciens]